MTHAISKFSSSPYSLKSLLSELPAHEVAFVGLRRVRELTCSLSARNGKPDGNSTRLEQGLMVEVAVGNGFAYAGTAA